MKEETTAQLTLDAIFKEDLIVFKLKWVKMIVSAAKGKELKGSPVEKIVADMECALPYEKANKEKGNYYIYILIP